MQPHEEWPLTYLALEETIAVFVDTIPMSDLDWSYNPLTNSVEFNVIPPEGSLVEIGYVIDQSAGDDDDSAGDDDDSSSS